MALIYFDYLPQWTCEHPPACCRAIELQPFHWGALAGSVLCLLKLRKYPEALEACRATLAVNPGCDAVHQYQAAIQRAMDGEGGANLEGDIR